MIVEDKERKHYQEIIRQLRELVCFLENENIELKDRLKVLEGLLCLETEQSGA